MWLRCQEPGRVYKLTLDGKIVGMLGESGHEMGQFNWIHAVACPSENTLYVADMNDWRVQKLILRPQTRATSSSGRNLEFGIWNSRTHSEFQILNS